MRDYLRVLLHLYRVTCQCPVFHRECVQCRAFGTGEKKDTCERDCSYFNLIKVKDRGKLPQPGQAFPLMHCKERDANDCWFYYTYAVNNKTEKEVHVVETLGESILHTAYYIIVTEDITVKREVICLSNESFCD